MLVLLCEGPKHNIFMISEFMDPGIPYLWILLHQNTSKYIRVYMDKFERDYVCISGPPILSFVEETGTQQIRRSV